MKVDASSFTSRVSAGQALGAGGSPDGAEANRPRAVRRARGWGAFQLGRSEHRAGGQREPEPDPLQPRDALAKHECREQDGAGGVQSGEH